MKKESERESGVSGETSEKHDETARVFGCRNELVAGFHFSGLVHG